MSHYFSGAAHCADHYCDINYGLLETAAQTLLLGASKCTLLRLLFLPLPSAVLESAIHCTERGQRQQPRFCSSSSILLRSSSPLNHKRVVCSVSNVSVECVWPPFLAFFSISDSLQRCKLSLTNWLALQQKCKPGKSGQKWRCACSFDLSSSSSSSNTFLPMTLLSSVYLQISDCLIWWFLVIGQNSGLSCWCFCCRELWFWVAFWLSLRASLPFHE